MLRPIPAHIAAQRLASVAELDPSGMTTPEALAAHCKAHQCAESTGQDGRASVAYAVVNGVVWVIAAAGDGQGMTAQLTSDLAAVPGARAIAFQTKRRGLVRRAERLGFQVCGYIMRRDL